MFRTSILTICCQNILVIGYPERSSPRLRRPSQECLEASSSFADHQLPLEKNKVDNFDHASITPSTPVPTQYQGENDTRARKWSFQASAPHRKVQVWTKIIWTVCPLQKICNFTGYITAQDNPSYVAIYITFHCWFQNGIADVVRNKLSGDLESKEVYETFSELIGSSSVWYQNICSDNYWS